MGNYTVLWRYNSNIGGPWAKGEVIQIDEALAARINIDSPGVLAVDIVPKTKDLSIAPQDRQIKKPVKKRRKYTKKKKPFEG